MQECSKAVSRRLSDSRFLRRYFVGVGLDIGAGDDCLSQYTEMFPLVSRVFGWDKQDGDAQFLEKVSDESFDFTHASHCLEHMNNPEVALQNWIRVTKHGGHIVCMVPDEDLYEQKVFPSRWNLEHQWTFTMTKAKSWSERSISLLSFLSKFNETVRVIKVEMLDSTYFYTHHNEDQTLNPITESAIEFVLLKL
jgi:SAM-dependent methyltransferase